jgi:dipeptidyl aminopeptidase/acylaminoacyl peptidase
MHVDQVVLRSARQPGLPADLKLAATLYLPESSYADRVPALVVGHGAGSHRARHDAFCRVACSQGLAVLALDLRGHGESGGAADGPLEQDIVAAARFLRSHPAVDGARVAYRGSSMGGFYGLQAAAQPTAGFTALALLCPASEEILSAALDEIDDRTTGSEEGGDLAETPAPEPPAASRARWDVPRLRAYLTAQDSLALAARVRCPVLLIHAKADEVVPFEHSLALARNLAGDVTLLALSGGSHTSAQHDPRIHRLTAGWLLDRVKSACTEHI